ncbi:ABC transporter substrate-binding protein [Actinophytocola oryzae]|uniref:Peptide/nickel transport system substrate-binding protein n=1 Tax=Actinophytocola oryzae TaxID=502181 RepID=A0A4R7W5M7_9PSEU|nr:ABC transporter substrate-binding protein [Actinophytocola oryzae]TDV57418.1 peptide/nickel transport system substrate-binding protein [Actinophytocola oryzae]
MKTIPTIATAGVLALALAACGGGGGGQAGGGTPVEGGTFTFVISADPGNLDPHFTSLSSTYQVDRFLYDTLVNIDTKGRMVAGLAEKWTATATEATFTLRDGVTCADGTPLTATQVAANISFVGDPKNASSRIGVFVPAGATATADEKARTVTVTSSSPDAFLDRNVGGLPIVCAKGMANRDLLKESADGTGLFTVKEAVAGDHYTLQRREDYKWGPPDADGKGLPDTVVIKVVQNESTSANLLLSGGANAAAFVGPDQQRLRSQKLFQRDLLAVLGEMWFNQKAGLPGADDEVRRALVQATDLDQLSTVLTGGTGKRATGLVPPGMGPCPGDKVGDSLPKYDKDAAKSVLEKAKPAITLFYPTTLGPTMQAGAELLQKEWSELGVQVTLKGGGDAETGQLVGGQLQWDVAFLPLNVSLPSQAVSFLSGPSAPDGTNFASIDNADYTAKVGEASKIPGADGCDTWGEAEKALYEQADVVPFANSNRPMFGKGAEFELSEGSLDPATIRMVG